MGQKITGFRLNKFSWMWLLRIVLCFSPVLAIICPDGWMNGGNNWCYKGFDHIGNRASAEAICLTYGATLTQIQNMFVNELVASLDMYKGESYWLGITCNGTTPDSCTNDDGTPLDVLSYNSFYGGQPNAPIRGKCVYMATRFAFWYSGNCETTRIKFACMWNGQTPYIPSTTLPTLVCDGDYSYFNGKCYKIITSEYPESEAESICESECGHLTSIHSEQENQFVMNLARSSKMVGNYARIGLYSTGGTIYSWTDGTSYRSSDYHNFGYSDPSIGLCVAMATSNDIVEPGQWINSPCQSGVPAVCKRDAHVTCEVPTVSTETPHTCETRFAHNNGSIFSPRYPSWYNEDSVCKYILTVPQGEVVQLSFSFVTLNDNSQIDLYNSITDSHPFVSINGTSNLAEFYKSTSKTLKLVFTSRSMSTYNMWKANFQHDRL